MIYRASHYVCDDTTAIMAFSDIGEAECSVSINLSDLVEEIKQEVYIGYNDSCKCLYVKLKENWRDLCEGDDI